MFCYFPFARFDEVVFLYQRLVLLYVVATQLYLYGSDDVGALEQVPLHFGKWLSTGEGSKRCLNWTKTKINQLFKSRILCLNEINYHRSYDLLVRAATGQPHARSLKEVTSTLSCLRWLWATILDYTSVARQCALSSPLHCFIVFRFILHGWLINCLGLDESYLDAQLTL